MIVYHGTTRRRAMRICMNGFEQRKPSKRVWFSRSKAYAEGRARTQARRRHDGAVVLTCELDLGLLRRRLGKKRVFHRGGNIAVDAVISATVLRSFPGQEAPMAPKEVAGWVNDILGLKSHKGVGARHPGLLRLSRWVANRITTHPHAIIKTTELLGVARQWLAEYFDGVDIDPERLRVRRRYPTIEVEIEPPEAPADRREERALELLEGDNPKRRVRGLAMLAELGEPDLFDWCMMYTADPSPSVRVAALRMMCRCEDGDVAVLRPLAASKDKNVRGAAIAAMARHSGADAAHWFERGLKDPSAGVRLETAGVLEQLDPAANRAIFELALYDPNPNIARRAKKLTAGKGFAKATW